MFKKTPAVSLKRFFKRTATWFFKRVRFKRLTLECICLCVRSNRSLCQAAFTKIASEYYPRSRAAGFVSSAPALHERKVLASSYPLNFPRKHRKMYLRRTPKQLLVCPKPRRKKNGDIHTCVENDSQSHGDVHTCAENHSALQHQEKLAENPEA